MIRQAHGLSSTARLWRTALLLAFTVVIAVYSNASVECTSLEPWCATTLGFLDYGWNSRGFIVSSVDHSGPAARAGFRVGDEIHFGDIGFLERWRLRDVERGYGGPGGEQLTYVLHRGHSTFTRTIAAQAISPGTWSWADWLANITGILALFCGALLVIRRPDLLEARALALILLFAVGVNGLTGTFVPWPALEFSIHSFADMTFLSVPIVCLTLYAGTLARPLSAVRKTLQVISYTAAAAITASYVAVYCFGYLLGSAVFDVFGLLKYFFAAGMFGSLACAFAAALASRGHERQRMLWIALGLTPIWAYYGVWVIVDLIPVWAAEIVFALTSVVMMYAILSRRCIDLGYVVNRTIVFAILSAFVLSAFILLEWALGEWFAGFNRSANIAASLALALILGLSLRFVHRRVEGNVDRVFFRKRHEDETALRMFARDAPFITSVDVLLQRTSRIVERHAGAERAAVLLQDTIARNENDPAILAMRSSHEPVSLHGYETTLCGDVAFPMISRGRLLGILICGPKTTGEAYAPDEWESLKGVASGVGHALDALMREADSAQTEIIAELRSISEKLTTLLHREDRTPI